jgi:hypothetical protein
MNQKKKERKKRGELTHQSSLISHAQQATTNEYKKPAQLY